MIRQTKRAYFSRPEIKLVVSDSRKFWKTRKQPTIGVLMTRCSENMQQIYRRTPMPKFDFNKVAKPPSGGLLPENY